MDGWGSSGCPVDDETALNGCEDWKQDTKENEEN